MKTPTDVHTEFWATVTDPAGDPEHLTEEGKLQHQIDTLLAQKKRLSQEEERKVQQLKWEQQQAAKRAAELRERQRAAAAEFNLPHEEVSKIPDGDPSAMRQAAYEIFKATPAHVLQKEAAQSFQNTREYAAKF